MDDELVTLLKEVDELKVMTLTETVREIDTPAQFLSTLLFSRHQTFATETLEIGLKSGSRVHAPLVRRGGEALLVPGLTDGWQRIQAPNIRIKMPFEAIDLLFTRRAGQQFHTTSGEINQALAQKIGDDLEYMRGQRDNAEELLCAQTVAGQISYQVSPNENYQVTIPRPATHTFTAPTLWDDADPDLVDIAGDCHAVKRIMNNDPGLAPTHCVLGTEAADKFLSVLAKRSDTLDKRRLDDGSISLQSQFAQNGAIYLGRYAGIEFWEYSRTVIDPSGTEVNLIRPKYAEFFHVGPAADRRLYYAAIPDIQAIQNGQHVSEMFSKSWVQEDPSQIMYLLHSRPLPWPRRANTWCSVKVISGT